MGTLCLVMLLILGECPWSVRRLPAARCGGRLDGVDPEPGGDVPQRLHSLLVRFVVVLHLYRPFIKKIK